QYKAKRIPEHDWAKNAGETGMRYKAMTTKHHEGYCHLDTKTTDYCSPKQGPGRDLVREYVEAARAEGLRVGFYYSLMDWHHPDGARCQDDPAARRRFVDYTHGLVRELMTNYGKIDILWYDVSWPLDADGWQSEKMNQMVFGPQPDGGIPPESARILTAVGQWMKTGGQAIYGADPCKVARSTYANFTRHGNRLYMHVHFWPGSDVSISGLRQKVTSASILKTGQ